MRPVITHVSVTNKPKHGSAIKSSSTFANYTVSFVFENIMPDSFVLHVFTKKRKNPIYFSYGRLWDEVICVLVLRFVENLAATSSKVDMIDRQVQRITSSLGKIEPDFIEALNKMLAE